MLRAGCAVRRFTSRSCGGYDPDAQALFAAMTTPPTGVRRQIINTLIVALKAAGVWSALDVLWVTAAADSQAALLNWKNPATFTLSAVNSPTFAADRGYTGDGATSRLNPSWVPSTNGVKFTQNDASLWVWSRTAAQGGAVDIGLNGGSFGPLVVARTVVDTMQSKVNDGTTSAVANTDGSGLIGASRFDASNKHFWRNGVEVGSAAAVASTGVGISTVWMLGGNATSFSTKQQAMGAFGGSLQGKEAAFYNAMLTYMTSVGAA